jgi:hypothetical protein
MTSLPRGATTRSPSRDVRGGCGSSRPPLCTFQNVRDGLGVLQQSASRAPREQAPSSLPRDTHQTVALDVVRRPKTTPIHELERYMRCRDCSQVRGYAYKSSHLVALRPTKISASDPPSTWWPGERDDLITSDVRRRPEVTGNRPNRRE